MSERAQSTSFRFLIQPFAPRSAVLAIPGVLFSGYRVPHPLEPRTELKIQTDGTLTPIQALKLGCEKVISQTGTIRNSFKAQCQLHQPDNAGMVGGPGMASGGYGAGGYGSNVYGSLDQRGAENSGYVDI